MHDILLLSEVCANNLVREVVCSSAGVMCYSLGDSCSTSSLACWRHYEVHESPVRLMAAGEVRHASRHVG